jgi:hypothetical protein
MVLYASTHSPNVQIKNRIPVAFFNLMSCHIQLLRCHTLAGVRIFADPCLSVKPLPTMEPPIPGTKKA